MKNPHLVPVLNSIVLIFCITLLAGCGAHRVTPQPAGDFLQDYTLLKTGKDNEPGLLYLRPDANIRSYHKIIIEPVTFRLKKGIDETGLNLERAKALEDFFTQSLRNALAPTMELVSKPAPDVLRLRVGLTDIVPVNRLTNTLTSVHVLLAVSAASRFGAGEHIGVSSMSAEVELTNAESNQVLFASVDRRAGEKSLFSSTESDVRAAIQLWSARIAEAITGKKAGDD